jgi:hypothetical protein
MCLTKEKFLQVLDLFPDYKQFLRRIGRQRWGTTNSDDVPTGLLPYVPYDEIEDRLLNKKRGNYFNIIYYELIKHTLFE